MTLFHPVEVYFLTHHQLNKAHILSNNFVSTDYCCTNVVGRLFSHIFKSEVPNFTLDMQER